MLYRSDTHATQLIENGVAGRLGQANTQITQNLYTHNTPKLQEKTAEIFVKNLQAICRQNSNKPMKYLFKLLFQQR